MLDYRKRESVMEKGERIYRLTGDLIEMHKPDGITVAMALRDVRTVRLAFAPTRQKPNRYLLTISDSNNGQISLDNMHFAGVGDFEDRSTAFSEFARFVIEAVSRNAPEAKMLIGAAPGSYVSQMLTVGIVFALLAFVIYALPVDFGSVPATFFAKAGIIIICLPVLFVWIVRARPRQVGFDEVTPDMFPQPGAPSRDDGGPGD